MEMKFHKELFNISAVNRCILFVCLFFTCSCSSLIGSSADYGYSSPSTSSSKSIHYTVKKGDTLSSIASRYSTTPVQIINENNLTNSNRIKVGQILKIKTNSENVLARKSTSTSTSAASATGTQKVAQTYSGRMTWPVGDDGGRITSKFGKRDGGNHDGIDVAAPKGTPVLASHDGRVIYADNKLRGYGNVVIIRGSGNIKTVYAHNSKMLVKTDQRVRQGQKIAEVGSTGKSTGNHLHYEIRSVDRQGRNIAVDPLPILTRSGDKSNYRVTNNITAIFVADEKRNGK